MEYTQWERWESKGTHSIKSLNPCCNGIYSMSIMPNLKKNNYEGLNPCCNGIYSMSFRNMQGRW